jgi:phage tail sheath gpL-like
MRRSADGRKLIEDPTVVAMARKYGKSPAQVPFQTAAAAAAADLFGWGVCSDTQVSH